MLIKEENECRLHIIKKEVNTPEGYTEIIFHREILKDGKVILDHKFDMFLTKEEICSLIKAIA